MTALAHPAPLTEEDYLAAEAESMVKHEYLGGAVHAMAGATIDHNRIAGNFYFAMHASLRGKPCEPFNSDTKVRIVMTDQVRFYYPDGMVICESNPGSQHYQERPVVVAEVLSEGTRRVDLMEKREAYLSIPSLRVLLLIEPGEPAVTVYRRSDAGEFAAALVTGFESVIPLPEIGAELSLADLYERVEFAPIVSGE